MILVQEVSGYDRGWGRARWAPGLCGPELRRSAHLWISARMEGTAVSRGQVPLNQVTICMPFARFGMTPVRVAVVRHCCRARRRASTDRRVSVMGGDGQD